jgi:hypothetical protein
MHKYSDKGKIMGDTKQSEKNSYNHAYFLAGLGALGVALQNYQAVEIFIKGLSVNALSANLWWQAATQVSAIGAGGICSGMVNFWMNVELLEGFFKRITSNEEYQYKKLNLSTLETIQYFGGILVFVVTGILFGLMAFTFAMTGPLAILSFAAGIFVACIMTIQEVETWLNSYEQTTEDAIAPLSNIELMGKWLGHIIAIGNVFALSLLFTLSVAQGLIALEVAALPALIIGFSIAFTFGAFTEYYFYNFYLADFCKNFITKWEQINSIPNAWFGFACVTINAFVNAAQAYAGIELLTGLLLTANIAAPPLALVVTIAASCAFFAGAASLILGLDFWIRQNPVKKAPEVKYPDVSSANDELDEAIDGYNISV